MVRDGYETNAFMDQCHEQRFVLTNIVIQYAFCLLFTTHLHFIHHSTLLR